MQQVQSLHSAARPPTRTRSADQVLCGLLMVGAVLHLLFILLPARHSEVWVWLGNLLPLAPFLFSALLALRTAAQRPDKRAAWLAFGLGQLGWFVGDAMYSALALWTHLPPYPSWADAFYLTMIPAFIAGLLLLNRQALSIRQWPVLTLDTLMVVLALAGAYWVAAVASGVQSGHGHPLALAVGLAYPASDLLMIALLFALCVWQPWAFAAVDTLILTAGLGAFLAADVAYQITTNNGSYQVGSFVDGGWTIGAALFGVAALAAQRAPHNATGPSTLRWRWVRSAAFVQLALPYTALLVALLLAALYHGTPGLVGAGVLRIAFAVVVLSAVRQALTQVQALKLQHHLDEQATHDPLTGLMNRAHLMQRLQAAIQDAQHTGQQVAVVFIDLDHFKTVNDTHGHDVGDQLLCEVARRLRASVPESDLVARLGGDEFVVVLTAPELTMNSARASWRLQEALQVPHALPSGPSPIQASLGVTLCPSEATSASEALRNADTAMYQAKSRGRTGHHAHASQVQRLDV